MKKLEFETSKGKFVLVDGYVENGIDLKQITEERAGEIVDSMQSGTVLGKLVTDLYNHTIEIYKHEGRDIKFISAVKCLHSLLKSKGVHLFKNPAPILHQDRLRQEQNTFYNPFIFKL